MAYRDYELDRDYGYRGFWRGRNDFDRDRWYGSYGAGGYGDWERGWNRPGFGWGGAGAYAPDYYGYGGFYGRSEPWYGVGYGNPGLGYGIQSYDRGYPMYGGYGNYPDEWRAGTGMAYEPAPTRYQARGQIHWRPGQQSHYGRGPRNYKRSDDRIAEDVNEALTRHPGIDASDIEVAVAMGEVTLTGTVENRLEKRMAEDTAESCAGVRDVHNQLTVAGGGVGTRGAEREVTRAPQQEGRSSSRSSDSRSATRQTSSSSRSE